MTDCRRAIEQIRQALSAGDQSPPAFAEALQHTSGCERCRRSLAHLVRALRVEGEDRLDCEQCQGHLPAFSLADPADAQRPDPWAAVRLHLATCPHCAAEYLALRELQGLDVTAAALGPAEAAAPDLSFLPWRRPAPAAERRRSWGLDQLGRLVVSFSAELVESILAAPPAPPALALKSPSPAQPPGHLRLDDLSDDLDVAISVERQRDEPARYLLLVEVRVPSRGGWPHLAGSQVRGAIPGRDPVVRVTDAFGRAAIGPLSADELSALTLTVVPVA